MTQVQPYDGHDGYACPFCNGAAVDVDFEAQPHLACLCPCHEQDNAQFFLDHAARSAEARRRDEQRAPLATAALERARTIRAQFTSSRSIKSWASPSQCR